MRESKLQTKCLRWVQATHPDILVANIHGGGWSAKGFPDIICCICGKFVAFELKVDDNDMQPDQRIWRKRILTAGGLHFCPRTLTEFANIIDEIIGGRNE